MHIIDTPSPPKVAVIHADGVAIGSWSLPSELIDNFDAQRELGWHVFFALSKGAREVRVVVEERP